MAAEGAGCEIAASDLDESSVVELGQAMLHREHLTTATGASDAIRDAAQQPPGDAAARAQTMMDLLVRGAMEVTTRKQAVWALATFDDDVCSMLPSALHDPMVGRTMVLAYMALVRRTLRPDLPIDACVRLVFDIAWGLHRLQLLDPQTLDLPFEVGGRPGTLAELPFVVGTDVLSTADRPA